MSDESGSVSITTEDHDVAHRLVIYGIRVLALKVATQSDTDKYVFATMGRER